ISYVEHDDCEDHKRHRRHEYSLLGLMVRLDPEPSELVRILNQRSFVVSTLRLAKTTLLDSNFLLNLREAGRTKLAEERSDQYLPVYLAYTWLWCMKLASSAKKFSLAKEAIDSGMVFVLEQFTLHDGDETETLVSYDLGDLLRLIHEAMSSGTSKDENEIYILKLGRQISTASRRLSLRPEVRSKIVKTWAEQADWVHSTDSNTFVELVCNTPGCDSTDAPTLQCSRCGQTYCSKACQRADWKFHKLRCATPE
ncbi:hypothetical protein DL93DRAFT_2086627, partial [Clavulina sp. PMI_390]